MLLRRRLRPDAALARAQELLELVSPDIEVGGLALGLGASIGGLARRGTAGCRHAADARPHRDGRAKTAGGHRVAGGGTDLAPATRPTPARSAKPRLRQAIEQDEFVLHYQSQFALDDGRPVGAEASLRWPREDGLWLPGRFTIGLIDEGGMTVALGEQVIAQAIAQYRRWREAGLARVPVSVNISPRQCVWTRACPSWWPNGWRRAGARCAAEDRDHRERGDA